MSAPCRPIGRRISALCPLPSAMSIDRTYRQGGGVVRSAFGDDAQGAAQFYRRYVDFVLGHLPRRPARILDVGCGTAWSTWLLRRAGHAAYGLDLHADAVEARRVDPGLPYGAADARRLPFAAATFDAVAMFQVLEHVPDPGRALEEAVRVLRPGGRLIVVGPNLLSVGISLWGGVAETARTLRRGRRVRRGPDTPRHPFGNTLPEIYAGLARNAGRTLGKLLGRRRPVRFLMREPDRRPPFHGDNDACYLCNPMDLVAWARHQPGVRPLRWWAGDRRSARWLWPVGGGTWVVLSKEVAQDIGEVAQD
jgi:SAM-dependent methyltransferase